MGSTRAPGRFTPSVEAASFKRLSGGRDAGQEDRQSFFRKGQAGDWASWFSAEQTARFEAQAGSLLTELGYTLATGPR